MGFLTPKSRKDLAVDYATAALTSGVVKRGITWVGGAVAGLVTLTAASAAISSAREEQSKS